MIIYRIVIVNFDLDRTRYGRKKLIGSLGVMGLVLAKGKLLKLFKASAESQLVTERLKLVDYSVQESAVRIFWS